MKKKLTKEEFEEIKNAFTNLENKITNVENNLIEKLDGTMSRLETRAQQVTNNAISSQIIHSTISPYKGIRYTTVNKGGFKSRKRKRVVEI